MITPGNVPRQSYQSRKKKMKISEFRQRYIEAMKMSERSKIAELFRLADDLESVEKTEENYRILSDVFSY